VGRLIRGETVTVLRPTTTTNRNGDAVAVWTSPTETDVERVAVAPTTSAEDDNQRIAGVTVGLTLYMPATADVTPTDRVTVRGSTYEVVGEVEPWVSPYTADEPGIAVTVQRVDG
jgi:head-tail adaptor